MRIHFIKKQTIEDFIKDNAQSKIGFAEFITKISVADWAKANDIKKTFGSADLLGAGFKPCCFQY